MAVKQKNVAGPVTTSPELRLQIILRFLQEIQNQDDNHSNVYSQIVVGLGTVQVPSDPSSYMKFIEDIKSIQDILKKANEKENMIFITLKALYDEISNPNKNPSPVMSIVLQLVNIETLPSAVKFILDSAYPDQNIERALHTLCSWLTRWTWTDNLGPLVLAFMNGLEHEQFYDILNETTLAFIEQLFKLVIIPGSRYSVFPVVFHMLRRTQQLQRDPRPFHKVVPHVPKVISMLSKDRASEAYLYQLVNLFTNLMDVFSGYDELYKPLKLILKSYYDAKSIVYKETAWSSVSQTILDKRKIGLYNLGNTCYMNSVLQALFMTKSYRNRMLSHRPDNNASFLLAAPLFSKLQLLFALLQYSKKMCLAPNDILTLLRPPGFVLGHQHDSSEFLGYLLDTLHEQEKTVHTGEGDVETVVQKSFGGRTVTVSHCSECGTKSEKEDSFRELQLSFPQDCDGGHSVQSLLEYFLQSEKLCGENQYRCDVCNRLTDGERITKIVSRPAHLILTLKHFKYDPVSQTRTKLLQRVTLDDRICLEGVFFDLYAAVVHCGSTVDSGHYYSLAKDSSTGWWYKFNDSIVTRASEDSLHLLKPPDTAYILFYACEDVSEPDNLITDELPEDIKREVFKDHSESNRDKSAVMPALVKRWGNDNEDDRPPPGCGGGGFGSTPGNMYVC